MERVQRQRMGTTWWRRARTRLRSWLEGRLGLATISTRVDDAEPGWTQLKSRPNDQDYSAYVQLYRDALEATRKNPLAKAIVDITTDFVIGDGITIDSAHTRLSKFIDDFWNHPQNRMDQRLEAMCDELTRAGDLFPVLFRNQQDGMSYVRFIPKEQIVQIVTAENDWETEIAYHQVTDDPLNPRVWLSPHHPDAADADEIMLHYAVNRPLGASFGEGDLDTVIPWLKRYSRMLEDRVRLHWAMRAFLWFVTVPSNLVKAKQSQYSSPPEPGSIVVKDEGEEWEVKSPTLRAADARHDLQAVRHMIDAVGYPPHWRGEGGDANLATARAMQLRPEQHLRRRQDYLTFVLTDLIFQSYLRAVEQGFYGGSQPRQPFSRLFIVTTPDISRTDNEGLSLAAQRLASTIRELFEAIPAAAESPTLHKLLLRLLFTFAGEAQTNETLDKILAEAGFEPDEIPDDLSADDDRQTRRNGHYQQKIGAKR
ncbi:MAG: hypothetical protein R3300_12920 [Candidatus Promineifilaceae bacterium]|nr:hypothetical protein [Candidatus Promineifilaceae bacterium]